MEWQIKHSARILCSRTYQALYIHILSSRLSTSSHYPPFFLLIFFAIFKRNVKHKSHPLKHPFEPSRSLAFIFQNMSLFLFFAMSLGAFAAIQVRFFRNSLMYLPITTPRKIPSNVFYITNPYLTLSMASTHLFDRGPIPQPKKTYMLLWLRAM